MHAGAENEIHDVAVVNVSLSEHLVYVGEEVGIEVVVRNEGNFAERFNLSVYVNQTSELIFVDAYLVASLGSLDQISIPFVWDTYGFASGNYTVEVEADVVDGEIEIMDNKGVSGMIWINADNTAPVIGVPAQNPLPDEVWEYEQVRISVNVSDLGGGVSRVILAWRTNDRVWWEKRTMAHSTENMYQEKIPGFYGGTNVSYRIIAYDESGNEAIRDHGGYYCVYHVIPEFPSFLILPLFMVATLLAVIVYGRKTYTETDSQANNQKPVRCM